MSQGGYDQYSGNPYSQTAQQPGGNPYATSGPQTGYVQQSGYGGQGAYGSQAGVGAVPDHYGANQQAGYVNNAEQQHLESQQHGYVQNPNQSVGVGAAPTQAMNVPTLSNQDFLARVEGVRTEIRQLTGNVAEIGSVHQRVLSSPDNSSSAQLENLVAQTQVLNTRIKDQIKFLETDTVKSGKNKTKESQVRTLKQNFRNQLEDYQKEEVTYRQRYREQIARQYKIVNPEASESEVHEAADADWNNEGVFQTALKSNRTGAANSVLGSVRARHNDIQKIESTLIELSQLFQDLAEAVVVQEPMIQQAETTTGGVLTDTEAGNKHLDKGIKSARNARKLKWWLFGIVVFIIIVLALVLGLYFGLPGSSAHNHGNNNNANRRLA